MNKWQRNTAKQIAEHYGYDNQSKKAVEECAELIQAIVKYKLHPKSSIAKMHLVDELADVEIMLEQIKRLLNIKNAVKGRIDFKLSRQLKRMDKEVK